MHFALVTNAGGSMVADKVVVDQVPEPTTMALLGIGSVFAIIRKKK